MNDNINEIINLINEKKHDKAEKLLDEISKNNNINELKRIIPLYQRLQKYDKAINICNKILQVEHNEKILKQKELLMEFLKFTQLDIYASTNLWNDPWFE